MLRLGEARAGGGVSGGLTLFFVLLSFLAYVLFSDGKDSGLWVVPGALLQNRASKQPN